MVRELINIPQIYTKASEGTTSLNFTGCEAADSRHFPVLDHQSGKRYHLPIFNEGGGTFCIRALSFLFACLFVMMLSVSPRARAEETIAKTSPKAENKTASDIKETEPAEIQESETRNPLTLKIMVVNPSQKYKQVYPLKAYLPEELKQENILGKEDLAIGYDSEKKAYFASGELELEPGQSVLKTIKVEDIWFIPHQKLDELSQEAHDIAKKLSATQYSEQGRLLLNNIEVLLVQILERQNDKNASPQEHISIYRDNKKKVYDIEMDLMSMRRFLSAASGESFLGSMSSQTPSLPSFMERMKNTMVPGGTVPGWILWRVIFSILIFLGIACFLFFGVLKHQIRIVRPRKDLAVARAPVKPAEEPKIGDFLSGVNEEFGKEEENNAENSAEPMLKKEQILKPDANPEPEEAEEDIPLDQDLDQFTELPDMGDDTDFQPHPEDNNEEDSSAA